MALNMVEITSNGCGEETDNIQIDAFIYILSWILVSASSAFNVMLYVVLLEVYEETLMCDCKRSWGIFSSPQTTRCKLQGKNKTLPKFHNWVLWLGIPLAPFFLHHL